MVGWAGTGGGRRRVSGALLLGSWDVECRSGGVWIERNSWAFSEVDGSVWCLWVVVVVSEAVLEVEL